MKRSVGYFPHDCNARNDERILELRSIFGPSGYAFWFMLCEIMAETDVGELNAQRLGGYALSLGLPLPDLQTFIQSCEDLGLLYRTEAGSWTNKRMKEHKAARDKMSQGGKRRQGAKTQGGDIPSPLPQIPASREAAPQMRLAVSFELDPDQELKMWAMKELEILEMQNNALLHSIGSSFKEVFEKWSDTIMSGQGQYSVNRDDRIQQYLASLRKYLQSWIRNGKTGAFKGSGSVDPERRELRA